MRVVQSGNDGALVQVDQLGALATQAHHLPVASDREKLTIADRRPLCQGAAIVLRRDFAVVKDQVGWLFVHREPPELTCGPFRLAGPRTQKSEWAVRRAPWYTRIPPRCRTRRNESLPRPS